MSISLLMSIPQYMAVFARYRRLMQLLHDLGCISGKLSTDGKSLLNYRVQIDKSCMKGLFIIGLCLLKGYNYDKTSVKNKTNKNRWGYLHLKLDIIQTTEDMLSESQRWNDMVADLHFPRFFGTPIQCEIARRFPRSVVKVCLNVQCKNISILSGVQPYTSTD